MQIPRSLSNTRPLCSKGLVQGPRRARSRRERATPALPFAFRALRRHWQRSQTLGRGYCWCLRQNRLAAVFTASVGCAACPGRHWSLGPVVVLALAVGVSWRRERLAGRCSRCWGLVDRRPAERDDCGTKERCDYRGEGRCDPGDLTVASCAGRATRRLGSDPRLPACPSPLLAW
jgi:hypothetical protein